MDIRACESDLELNLVLLRAGHISEAQFGLANELVKESYDGLLLHRQELNQAPEVVETITVTRDKTIELRFREGPLEG